MKNELKNAIRFDDFYAVYGSQGVVAMAWCLGAQLADGIRAEQHSFPFLHINGASASGKTFLLSYLSQLIGQESFKTYAPDSSSRAGRMRTLVGAGKQIVVNEPVDAGSEEIDWDELKILYNSGAVFYEQNQRVEKTEFHGALVICASQPLKCSEAVESRMVLIQPSVSRNPDHRHHVDALSQLATEQASAFGLAVEQREDQLLSTFHKLAPVYSATLLDKQPAQPNPRAAKNWGQLMALVDVLSLLLNLTQEQRQGALEQIEHKAGLASLPY